MMNPRSMLMPAFAMAMFFGAATESARAQAGNNTETVYQVGPFVVAARPPVPTVDKTLYPMKFSYSAYSIDSSEPEVSGTFFFDCSKPGATSANYEFRDSEGVALKLEQVDSSFQDQVGVISSTQSMYAHGCGRTPPALNLTRQAAGNPRELAERIRDGDFELQQIGPFSRSDIVPLVRCWTLSSELGVYGDNGIRQWATRLTNMLYFAVFAHYIQFGYDALDETVVEDLDTVLQNKHVDSRNKLNSCWAELNRQLKKM